MFTILVKSVSSRPHASLVTPPPLPASVRAPLPSHSVASSLFNIIRTPLTPVLPSAINNPKPLASSFPDVLTAAKKEAASQAAQPKAALHKTAVADQAAMLKDSQPLIPIPSADQISLSVAESKPLPVDVSRTLHAVVSSNLLASSQLPPVVVVKQPTTGSSLPTDVTVSIFDLPVHVKKHIITNPVLYLSLNHLETCNPLL